ncbi:MAG: exopolysaccharide biosynthesis polyprenyl glycosylphosphotransferase [Hyphomonadaceae bacterium]|nr:exopolysaccharide biosynthesis polyprenyl glycosylphosphotransferase [Hyphomonadaceae bacterium]
MAVRTAQPGRRAAIVAPRRVREPIRPAVGGAAKRAFDIIVASAALVFLAPALILIAIAVRLESAGPALFTQRRGGFRGKPFAIYKFRTMTVCDDGHSIAQASPGDARITRLGAFLRRTSLDELPQFFNVLRGDMSIVGPRPHALAHDRAFETIEPRYRQRNVARPGITGLAQISGARGPTQTSSCIERRVSLDLDYISRWSLWLDAKIVALTVVRVFTDDTAF